MTSPELAAKIEHTLLRPDATRQDLERHCSEARQHGFYAVCVHGSRVPLAWHCLEDSPVKLVTVAGFPFGAGDSDVKRFETETAIDNGAHEIDTVINIGWLKDGQDAAVLRELRDVVEAAEERPVKVIIELGLLSEDEVKRACELVLESGAGFVKTSTGYGPRGATVDDVRLLRRLVGPEFGIKAAGGIRDAATARALLEAGADRLGTSASLAIILSGGTS
jgi:deoxyribose-phosphate aldolase